ncbi:hypothetical protein ES703_44902 [subsurface metagenome]
MLPHLIEHIVHPVAPHGHRHAIWCVRPANGAPGGQPNADRFPAAVEAQVAGGVNVHGQIRFLHQAVNLDVISIGRSPQVDEVVRVFGILAGQTRSEALH